MSEMKITETLDKYRDYLDGSRGFRTAKEYEASMKRFVLKVGDRDINDLCIGDLITYKAHLSREGRSSSYISTELSALTFYIRFLRKVFNVRNIDIEDLRDLKPKVSQKIPEPLEDWEVTALLEQAIDNPVRTIVRLLLDTGLRVQELLSLKRQDVFEREIVLNGETVKVTYLRVIGKGRKERHLPLTERSAEELRRYIQWMDLGHPNGYESVFDYSYPTIWRMINDLGQRCGVRLHPHKFRHTYGTLLKREGTDIGTISKLMGHSSIGMTMRYARVVDEEMVKAVRRLRTDAAGGYSVKEE